MAIEIDDNGDFVTNETGQLQNAARPRTQCAKAEMRCLQGSWFIDLNYGKNLLVWEISQSSVDRCLDLSRIAKKYVTVGGVTYNSEKGTYDVKVLSND